MIERDPLNKELPAHFMLPFIPSEEMFREDLPKKWTTEKRKLRIRRTIHRYEKHRKEDHPIEWAAQAELQQKINKSQGDVWPTPKTRKEK
jgi:hypothetical protein